MRARLIAACLVLAACPSGGEDLPVLYAPNWVATYQEVRSCRRSGDHDLNYVRILADPAAVGPYTSRAAAFPVGAVVLKPEYADEACTDVVGYTVMRKEAAGFAPASGDWHWQEVSADGKVTMDGQAPRCVGCHRLCGVSPDGYDWTCAVP
jgi:hypothetical protein